MPKRILRLFVLRFHLILFLLGFTRFSSLSQEFGNEWIQNQQTYYKIKVSESGIYKISFSDLKNKFGQTSSILDPSKFQLFSKGQEIPLYITGTLDGSFDEQDVVYFYGKKNDASLDKALYKNPQDIPNTELSLFSDDNVYFLTYSNGENGKRYRENQYRNNALISEAFLLSRQRINFSQNYYPGEYILDVMSLSEYTEGEGYLGSSFGKGETLTFELNTPGFIPLQNFQPSLSFFVAGRSNASSTNGQGKNHHFRLALNGVTQFDSLFTGYKTIRKSLAVNIEKANTVVSISAVDDIGATTDFQAPGYIEIIYGRDLNLSSLKSLEFRLSEIKDENLLEFKNGNLANPVIFEKNGDNVFFPAPSFTNEKFLITQASSGKEYILFDLNDAKPTILNKVIFKGINPSSAKRFLIVTNQTLTAGSNAYKSYNELKGMPTALAFTEDLYNEFYYGFHHPMAIRNYCNYLIQKGNVKPEYLLLLGKGFETPKGNLENDLVPTMGYPGSDNMLTSGLNGSNLEPGLATGRIPAKTDSEVLNYLNKLKVYETLGVNLWRKKIMHISGGKNSSESSSFINYQKLLFQKAANSSLGASQVEIRKNVASPVTDVLTEQIVSETRKGVGLISFLGHGSSNVTEIYLGDPNDLGNEDKPTVYLVNGCSTGAVFNNYKSLSEQFLLQDRNGAIAWIGTTSEGVASYLNGASSNFYANWFEAMYGESISSGIKEGLKTFQNGADKLNLAHTRQYIYLGDPSTKFFSPEKPDYFIDENSIFIPAGQTTVDADLKIKVMLRNQGKADKVKTPVKISRRFASNDIVSVLDTVISVYNTDSLTVLFKNKNFDSSGKNKISIDLNKNHLIDELNYGNNFAEKDYFLPGNSISRINPIDKSIVGGEVVLSVLSENLLTQNAQYVFELDTTPSFSSPKLIKSGIIVSGIFGKWQPNVHMVNNTVYYWRAKLNTTETEEEPWINSSFTYIKDFKQEGENFAHIGQVVDFSLQNLDLKTPFGFNFQHYNMSTNIKTRGDDVPSNVEKRLRVDGFAISYAYPEFDGFSMLAFNPYVYAERFQYPSPHNYINPPASGPYEGPSGQYVWNLNNPVEVDSLIRYLKQIPFGYHLVGYNGHNASFKTLPQNVKDEFFALGLLKFSNIDKGEPYAFWVTKGDNSTVKELTADYNSGIPPREQSIDANKTIAYSQRTGNFTTEPIGPAVVWNSINTESTVPNPDEINIDVIGINASGKETFIRNSAFKNSINVSDISSHDYPYLKLKYNLTNQYGITPSLGYVRMLYTPTPDIIVYPVTPNIIDYLNEGDSIKVNLVIKNFGTIPSDSLILKYTVSTEKNSIKHEEKLPFIINSHEENKLSIAVPTLGLSGNANLVLNINQRDYAEHETNNNIFAHSFNILKDNKPPLINVTFDGREITNGEIVSSSPNIRILCLDENKFLSIKDTSFIHLYLKEPQSDNYRRIYFSRKDVNIVSQNIDEANEFIVNFNPRNLLDGKYSLKVASRDASGNKQMNDYIADFEVVGASTISNFYPYPNPVIDKLKFVFTLTGHKIPENIKIQIFTQTGKVVKELFLSDLSYLRIGHNITDVVWDCTDEHGDRLANGVYFYKVDIPDKDFKHRATGGDKFFKNHIGKIYVIR